jgi:hypothetical protein
MNIGPGINPNPACILSFNEDCAPLLVTILATSYREKIVACPNLNYGLFTIIPYMFKQLERIDYIRSKNAIYIL